MIRSSLILPTPWPATASLVLALLLIWTWLPTPSIFAAGEDIQVLANNSHVRFPDGVVFDLEVEGAADIVEVRLYYRVPQSGTWTYSYPEMSPARHVETSFNLNVSGASYIPPGTEVEYYYSIRDSRGSVLETIPRTFTYIDDRFQWQTVEAGPLTIYWQGQSEARVNEVAREVERSLEDIGQILRVSLEEPVRGIIYNSRSEAKAAFPNQSRATTEQQVFQGFAYPERGLFVGIGLSSRLIVHETAHLLLNEAVSSPGARVPAWVNEGFASHVESGRYGSTRVFSGGDAPDRMPLRHMDSVPGRISDIRYFYRKAESVVGYLLETHGDERFRAFLQQLDGGKDDDEALSEVYGFDLDGLDRRWSSPPTQEVPDDSGGRAVPFGYWDSVLIALLVLVVMALTLGNLVLRKLRRRAHGPEEWDGLTEEEWEGRP